MLFALFAALLLPTQASSCDATATLTRARIAAGEDQEQAAALTALGIVQVSSLPGTVRFDVDLEHGRHAERFSVPSMGSSATVFDGQTLWAQDRSGGVHALDSPYARKAATTDAYLARRGYFESGDGAMKRCIGTQTQDGRLVTVIRVTPAQGEPADLAFDAKGLLASVTEIEPTTIAVTRYGDYRTVGNLVLPFLIQSGTQAEPADGYAAHITRYIITPRVHDADFSRPVPTPVVTMLHNARSTTVPIALEAGNLVVWASIDGKPAMPFILDTGGHAILTTGAAKSLGLHAVGAGESGGSGSGTIGLQFAHVSSISIGDAELRDQPVLVIPYPFGFYERGRRAPLAGILGLEIFERFAARVDYANHTLSLTPSATFRYAGNGTAVPLHFEEDMPSTLDASADGHSGDFAIDTGNSGALVLYGHYLERYGFFVQYAKGMTVHGTGTGGSNTGSLETLREFIIGGHLLKNLPAYFTRMSSGSFSSTTQAADVGTSVLSRFIPTLDYANETMYLDVSPNAPAPAMNRAGLGFAKNSPEAFDVVGVRPGSPAALTGIEAGDRIVKVNGEDVEQLAYFDLYNLVTGPRGAQIHLTIEHRGSERDVVLVLK